MVRTTTFSEKYSPQKNAKINCLNKNYQTPLMMAALFNHGDVIEHLLSNGANIERQDMNGLTPLLLASTDGNEQAVKILLKNGANIFAVDKEDKTCLFLAASRNHKGVVDRLLRDERSMDLLDRNDRYDNTPLHVAGSHGFREIVLMLLNHGADVDRKNEDEQTPLLVAAKAGRPRYAHYCSTVYT